MDLDGSILNLYNSRKLENEIRKYCRTANFHVLVILTNLTNEKNSLK